jgi:hypothetical protein
MHGRGVHTFAPFSDEFIVDLFSSHIRRPPPNFSMQRLSPRRLSPRGTCRPAFPALYTPSAPIFVPVARSARCACICVPVCLLRACSREPQSTRLAHLRRRSVRSGPLGQHGCIPAIPPHGPTRRVYKGCGDSAPLEGRPSSATQHRVVLLAIPFLHA